MPMKKLVIFTGAGISAESGIKTFRDSDGLWENYKIEDVATINAWHKNMSLVQEFYNQRRKTVLAAKPNKAHYALVELESRFKTTIITQNIDDLHERAGSKNVIHLHGEITKSCSSINKKEIFPIKGWKLKMGELAPDGSQLRPFIVWFGEDVPMMYKAIIEAYLADIFVVIGTSLQVYPAANLLYKLNKNCKIYAIDPHLEEGILPEGSTLIKKKATVGVDVLIEKLLK